MKKTIATTLITGGIIFGALTVSDKLVDKSIAPVEVNGTTINYSFTDDNSNEDLIIATDQEKYSSWDEAYVNFAVKNTSTKDQNVKIQFTSNGESSYDVEELVKNVSYQVSVNDYKDNQYTCESDWIEGKTIMDGFMCGKEKRYCSSIDKNICIINKEYVGNHLETRIKDVFVNITEVQKEDLRYLDKKPTSSEFNVKDQITGYIQAGETKYYRAKLKFTPKTSGEFYIKAYGDQGGYGSLDPWYSASWNYRKQIDINPSYVTGSSDLTNFAVLYNVTDSNLASNAQADGDDILFTSSDGTTKLDHEIDKYTTATGELHSWVRIPTLSYNATTTIYMYYGNSGASNQQNKTGVWDSNYKGVWHLPDGSSLTANDSTSNANNGTLQNSPTATTGKIDGGVNLASASSQYITAPALGTDFGTNFTVSGWIKRDGTQQVVGSLIADQFAGYVGHAIFWGDPTNGLNSNRLYGGFYDGTAWRYAGMTSDTSDLTWVYAVLTYDGSTIKLYIDGAAPFTSSFSGYTRISGLGTNIGKRWDLGNYVNGIIDEVRYSDATRSADWITTEYNNQNATSTFYITGSQETNTPTSTFSPWQLNEF